MQDKNGFWLNLHRLAESYEAEGASHEERARTISAQLLEMPQIAQREVLHDLCGMVAHLPVLYTALFEALNEAERFKYAELLEDEDWPVPATTGKR